MPQITISDGSVVNIEVGDSIVRKLEFKATPEEGALEVVGFDSGYPLVMLDGVESAISGDSIEAVVATQVPLVSVDLGGGNIINLPASQAAQVQALIVLNNALDHELDLLRSGGEVAELIAQVEQLQSEVIQLKAKYQKVLDLKPKLVEAKATLDLLSLVLEQ